MIEISWLRPRWKRKSNEENKREWKFENNYSVSKIAKTEWIDEDTTGKLKLKKSSLDNSVSLNIWWLREISIVSEWYKFCSGWA